jgi:hypothetical protein
MIFIWGCCGNASDEVTYINESYKQWFPYKSNGNILYKSSTGMISDTLIVTELDTSIQNVGYECAEYEENRSCYLHSKKLGSLSAHIILEPTALIFYVQNENKGDEYAYDLSFGKSGRKFSNEFTIMDSIEINNVVYRNVCYFLDSKIDISMYYNYKGLLRYINQNDTFDLAD